jgi:tetratricopeptide (TPR) repeat protein
MSVQARTFLCWFMTDLGQIEEAAPVAERALQVANTAQQPYSQLLANMAEGYRLFRAGEMASACDYLERAYSICRAGSFLALDAMVSGWYAAVLIRVGRHDEAGRIVRRVIDFDLGQHCCIPSSYYVYDANARLLAAAGRGAEAMEAITHAVSLVCATRDPVHYAYALFSRAELSAALGGDAAQAERDYRWALRRARKIGMRNLQADCERALDVLAEG